MTERSVRIAVNISDGVTRKLVCGMLSGTGAHAETYDNITAIKNASEAVQAIILSLDASPEGTFEAIAALRKQLAAVPIYVVSDIAGQQHAERAKALGATQVIPRNLLQRSIGPLVEEISQTSGIPIGGIRSPGWIAPNDDQGYDLESVSIELEEWESMSGNVGAAAVAGSFDGPAPRQRDAQHDEQSDASLDAHSAREQHLRAELKSEFLQAMNEQIARISDAHLEREKHLRAEFKSERAELKSEFLHAMNRKIAASEAKVQHHLDAKLAEAMRENAAEIRRVKLMTGALTAIALLVLAAIGAGRQLGLL